MFLIKTNFVASNYKWFLSIHADFLLSKFLLFFFCVIIDIYSQKSNWYVWKLKFFKIYVDLFPSKKGFAIYCHFFWKVKNWYKISIACYNQNLKDFINRGKKLNIVLSVNIISVDYYEFIIEITWCHWAEVCYSIFENLF